MVYNPFSSMQMQNQNSYEGYHQNINEYSTLSPIQDADDVPISYQNGIGSYHGDGSPQTKLRQTIITKALLPPNKYKNFKNNNHVISPQTNKMNIYLPELPISPSKMSQ